jgi:hypothetical protein
MWPAAESGAAWPGCGRGSYPGLGRVCLRRRSCGGQARTQAPSRRVSARLNLIEGDLTITVTGAAGYTARCAWPWPVDAQGRAVDLAPGSRLVGAVPLIGTDTSAPLFPSPGDYTLGAEFDVAPGVRLISPAVTVRRTPEQDGARAAALRDHDVIQSLLSASPLGNAAAGLHAVAEGTRTAPGPQPRQASA